MSWEEGGRGGGRGARLRPPELQIKWVTMLQ